ncbi:helix-turn-helix transcriptional regulator [Flammeovirga kamogawensis]|uniref:WYL domain-containing protein n=1 Tax=Flammeovirga kamogawensis TaxID=373891 RepID=A0ABX8GW99_9BACT|nr:WYL domain-containing protein [Flammeovirga kamogawensis]MBB6461312.1 putative DNA-binding transcriptional regulator YafY [Flammeovirga kamogawensis]QWG07869.1 WYL domain-containing protein [Flammeovirga kamogawensis]TRX69676.1 WYL domain-containing protein [Flammeovirga kamogawensis]
MAQNKNALIRYKTIDKCLQNKYREWTLNDLIEACSEALYEYEGKTVNVSKRCIQLDIQIMRSDKLGYNAPIIVYNKKFYRYKNDNYTITNIPLSKNDMYILSESIEVLKQFKDFSLFSELSGIFQRLEDKVYIEKTKQDAIIHLDKNENLKGLKYLDPLYQSILQKKCLFIYYQSFSSENSNKIDFTPFILKEYNNRWFVVGSDHNNNIITLALDRIHSLVNNLTRKYDTNNFNGDKYYNNTIGVTVISNQENEEINLKINNKSTPYVLTKPLHHTQEVISIDNNGNAIIKIIVNVNYELERIILGFGDSVTVLKPRKLRKRIEKVLQNSIANYNSIKGKHH